MVANITHLISTNRKNWRFQIKEKLIHKYDIWKHRRRWVKENIHYTWRERLESFEGLILLSFFRIVAYGSIITLVIFLFMLFSGRIVGESGLPLFSFP